MATPVVWWWQTDDGRRCAVLTDRALAVTGALDADGVAALDAACRAGEPLKADLGAHPGIIALDTISALSLRPDPTRLVVEIADGVTSWTVEPGPEASPVAVTIFDVLRRRLAPENPVRATDVARVDPAPTTQSAPVLLAVLFAVVGLVAATAWRAAAGGARVGGPVEGPGQIVNDLFAAAGPFPALVAFGVAVGAFSWWRLRPPELPPLPPARGPEIRVLVGYDREPEPEEREIPADALVLDLDIDGEDPLAALLRR